MKVLHVNDYRSAGGCEILVDTTMRLLEQGGVETSLFTSEDVPGHRRTPLSYVAGGRCPGALARRVDESRPDVVHLHNFYHELSPAILAPLAVRDVRVVMTAHDYHLLCPSAGLCRWRRGVPAPVEPTAARRLGPLLTTCWDPRGRLHSLLKVAQHVWNYRLHRRQRAIDVVICPSRAMQRAVEALGLKTAYVPNPAPAAAGAAAPRGDELHWVFAGRIEAEKGLVEFLRDVPANLPGRMTIAGDGARRAACVEVCRQRGLDGRVRFTGEVPPSEAQAIIATAHVVVLPSITPENAPMSLLEAIALGATILVADRGGMREIAEASGIGYAYDPDRPADLAASVQRIARAHADGTLLDFDVGPFLEARRDSAYLEEIMRVYGAGPCAP